MVAGPLGAGSDRHRSISHLAITELSGAKVSGGVDGPGTPQEALNVYSIAITPGYTPPERCVDSHITCRLMKGSPYNFTSPFKVKSGSM